VRAPPVDQTISSGPFAIDSCVPGARRRARRVVTRSVTNLSGGHVNATEARTWRQVLRAVEHGAVQQGRPGSASRAASPHLSLLVGALVAHVHADHAIITTQPAIARSRWPPARRWRRARHGGGWPSRARWARWRQEPLWNRAGRPGTACAGRLARTARRTVLHLSGHAPWADLLLKTITTLQARAAPS
jgi:hypothetical protein